MPIWMQVLAWISRSFVLLLFALTVLPFVHTGWWVARAADFPRLQLLVVSLACAMLLCVIGLVTPWRREPWFWVSLCGLLAGWQASYIVRFTPLWPWSIQSSSDTDLSLVIANLDFRNDSKAAGLDALTKLDADLYLLIEVDEAWSTALGPLREARPHRVESIREKGLGVVLWSRLPLKATSIEYLVSEDRPSVHGVLEVNSQPIHFVGTHPTPPGLPIRDAEGRHDSRIRDAELMLIAERVASQPNASWIVAGDFNDVAWSRTTMLFREVSGLRDPRVGRGLVNTYHADRPLLRYPLDHVFVSPTFSVGTYERERVPGSDHFAVRVTLSRSSEPAGSRTNPRENETDAPEEMIEEGRSDAEELNRRAD